VLSNLADILLVSTWGVIEGFSLLRVCIIKDTIIYSPPYAIFIFFNFYLLQRHFKDKKLLKKITLQ